ncbi:MAG: hypothetical protein A2X84_08420 [Desulfuromonadaceae bacterium GWC2_58_13]|nr:MAG: hypothetical protein A2X84_08420 [Desulfuromonadaceae bacterium GWC2_58_13]
MEPGRFSLPIILLLLAFIWPSPALAGWWFGKESAWEKSGLDLRQGYDQNTVISVSGTVVSIDLKDDEGPALAVVKTETETVSLVLGPRDFWQEQGLSLSPGDPVSVRGSKAQGQDGVVYLMVQSIGKSGDLQETTLRNRIGRPVWSGVNRVPHQGAMPMRQMRSGRNH